ncbi:MAG: ABC transporter ATP-binding protein [Planctomycetota bacterium]|jgi:ATP-binding cassette subfamily B protein|nr:ABC transporter ATP-binding protein [Planctomycetota bacterium]
MPLRPSPLLRTFSLYRRQLPLLALVAGISALVNVGMAVQQHLFGTAFDELLDGTLVQVMPGGGYAAGRAWMWGGILLAIVLARGVVGYGGQVLGMLLGQRLLHDLRDRVLAQVQSLDQAWHRRHGAGEIVTRATRDADKVRDAVVIGTRQLLDVFLLIAAVLGLLWIYHPLLGLVPTLCMAAAVYLNLRYGDRLVQLDRQADDAYDILTQDLTESVSGVRVVKAFTLEEQRIESYRGHLQRFMDKAAHALRWAAVRLPVPQALFATAHGWCLAYGGMLVGSGALTRGDWLVGLMLMTGVIFRMEMVARAVRMFADARASAARLWELLDARSGIEDGADDVPAGALALQMRAVGVHDGPGRPVLDGLNLDLEPGQVVALIGATGSGKSTLASLLPRLRDPDAGVISVAGSDGAWCELKSLRTAALRRRVQVVAQDSFLFSMSVRDNMLISAPDADEDQIWAALALADAADFVRELEHGIETVVGERGVTLSGGQRQRLCLARALVAQPGLLVLDDSVSAVDAVTERRILSSLRSGAEGATVLIIASRLSSILLADAVAVLDEGAIRARGSHHDLAQGNRHYRELLCLDEAGQERPA